MAMDWWLLSLNLIRVIITISIMGIASYSDIKSRSAPNKLWIILGLVGISLFECQIIIEFGYDALPYLIGIIPITVLFLSFLVCEWIIDFEAKKINHSWLFMIFLSIFAFFYLFQLVEYDFEDIKTIFGPIILFLGFFVFIEIISNYLDYRIYLRLKRNKSKARTTMNKNPKDRGKTTKDGAPIANDPQTNDEYDADEHFSWSLFTGLMVFCLVLFFMDDVIQSNIAQAIGLAFMVLLPIILIVLYMKYHSNSIKMSNKNSSDDRSSDEDSEELSISAKDHSMIQGLKILNYFLAIMILFVGFYLIIYYSLIIEIPATLLVMFIVIIWLLLFYGFYNIGLPRGGADTKALMALVVVFPIYPIIQGINFNSPFYFFINEFPELGIAYIFPFAFSVLMNAALIMLFYIISLFIFNAIKHDLKFPHSLLGYMMPLNQVKHKFVWPMEKLEDGKRRLMAYPDRDLNIADEINNFHKLGIKQIWVTPKIPFLIPLTISVILTLTIGNILFDLIFSFI
jgi:preflagellin peptidase FlaK